ncbi:MetQ/NlpA family ABC transporter substrate-binding protein [Arcanobacterium phocisimile]|uniref:Lipoprotein n=1 Tax=Arcanobacterium phocisimile TaxID=1302235 RepID=A0ABX7IG27_9ACTO|nr:MetQ/NlpA family ABC transporter substrate-binding protein [Arcanobacterium phocisimile]QRV01509.1 MetQ/NlpA family ABC transporter substrate-binding protein [Arcanobacterium phocisimile]
MKIRRYLVTTVATLLALTACASETDTANSADSSSGIVTITVGASPVPHADILKYVDENLAADEGLKIEVKEYTDYIQPNVALEEGELDANYFQHLPYFDTEVAEKGYNFDHGAGIQIEPYAVFSKKLTDITSIPEGGSILVNNDPSNQARALKLLEKLGLFELKDVENPTIHDLAKNTHKYTLIEADAAIIPVQLPDVDIAVINGNYALDHGLNPTKDAIAIEDGEDNPYANILAWKKDSPKNEAIAKLEKLLHSPQVADFIRKSYPNGEIIPAF